MRALFSKSNDDLNRMGHKTPFDVGKSRGSGQAQGVIQWR
jgi:hypothetical protein